MEIPCTEKSAKSETSNYGLRFLRFFEMPLQKNVKSRVFFGFSKKRKKRILELWFLRMRIAYSVLLRTGLFPILYFIFPKPKSNSQL